MLSEEAFVLVLGLVAIGLLVLGILEVFLPTRRPRPGPPRDPRRLIGFAPQAQGDPDPALGELAAAARAALWPAREAAVAAMIHRQEFQAARQWSQQALADPACPSEAAAALRAMMTATPGGEVAGEDEALGWPRSPTGACRPSAGRSSSAASGGGSPGSASGAWKPDDWRRPSSP